MRTSQEASLPLNFIVQVLVFRATSFPLFNSTSKCLKDLFLFAFAALFVHVSGQAQARVFYSAYVEVKGQPDVCFHLHLN